MTTHLTKTQYCVLCHIRACQLEHMPKTATQLAAYFGVANSSMGRTVRRLAAKGYVIYKPRLPVTVCRMPYQEGVGV